MTEQLKPCPFCGGAAHFFKITDLDEKNFGGEGICCGSCPITTDLMFSLMEDCKPKLAEAWNRRAQPAQAVPVAVVKYQVGGLAVHIVGDVREGDELFKAPQQAEAVPQKPKLIGWRTSDYLMETSDKDKADNWSVHHEMLPIFEGDPYTKLVAAPQQAEAVPSEAVRDAELDARVAEAEAKWQATIRDAARYRWLREADDDADKLIQADCRGVYLPQTEALDRRIDAAMAQGEKP